MLLSFCALPQLSFIGITMLLHLNIDLQMSVQNANLIAELNFIN